MDEHALREMIEDVRAGRLSRRRFVRTMIGLGLTAPLAAQMLAAGLGESLFEKTKAGLQSVMDLTNKMVESFRAGGFQQVFKDLVPADLQPKIQAIANAFLNFGETVYNVGAKIMASIQEAPSPPCTVSEPSPDA